MKKRTTAAYAMIAAFFLSGCTTDGIADATRSTKEIEPIEQALITELNTVTKQEKGLQETVEFALSKNKEEKPFTDKNSTLFKNIDERKNSLKAIKVSVNELDLKQKSLVENDGTKLPEKEIDSLTTSMKEISTSLDDYTKNYEQNLAEEEKYFQSLGTKEATYQTLIDGIAAINEQDSTNKEQLKKLNEQFNQLRTHRKEAQEQLSSLSESTK
ncbi:Putative cell-wall binding lipoprotein [Carnobacterium iners]|uniref:Putative cell-wall binding lipoprotein n=1 Tax=Carnobacterium iners TaxID=1073423 RepID=A0A1X7NHG1_9LACT|nr:YkyA family protein [Carnobacterium iners]SEK39323.1 Putative cell-wall binding lipoprotein [Carnobacterium iners]SMH36385.1 Putative cell-wall binding lipoprotein [Carnobacterium iners]